MDIQKFKETYKQIINESADNSELKNYIRSIVEEVLEEARMRMPVWKQDAMIMVTKTKYPKLYAAIKGVNNGTAKGPFNAYYVDDSKPPSNETEFKNNLDKLQQRLDKLEKIIGTDKESKSKELKNFLASFKYEERPKMDHSKYVDPCLDRDGRPRPGLDRDGYPCLDRDGRLRRDLDRDGHPRPGLDRYGYPRPGVFTGNWTKD